MSYLSDWQNVKFDNAKYWQVSMETGTHKITDKIHLHRCFEEQQYIANMPSLLLSIHYR